MSSSFRRAAARRECPVFTSRVRLTPMMDSDDHGRKRQQEGDCDGGGMTGPTPPLIVAGMHRSGTSMMAALLSKLSVDMGRGLVAPDAHNFRGYFEDVEFLSLQRRMLSESCASDDGGHPDWGWTEHETLDRRGFERFALEARSLLASRADRRGD